jgi:predicted transcriptional regulator
VVELSDEKYAFVMMIRSDWWSGFRRRLGEGKEIHSYVQAGLAPPKDASLVFFYIVKPVGEVAGYAEFVERKTGDADAIWNEFGSESVMTSKKQYEGFLGARRKVSFIRVRKLHEASKPIALNSLLLLLGLKRLQRRGFYVNRETANKLIFAMD